MYEAWANSHEDDKDGREKIYSARKMLFAFDNYMKNHLDGQKLKKSTEFFG